MLFLKKEEVRGMKRICGNIPIVLLLMAVVVAIGIYFQGVPDLSQELKPTQVETKKEK